MTADVARCTLQTGWRILTDMDTPLDSHCTRCLRTAPPVGSTERLYWETLRLEEDDSVLVICPDCVTPEGQSQLDEDVFGNEF